jgi:hypothetical protein
VRHRSSIHPGTRHRPEETLLDLLVERYYPRARYGARSGWPATPEVRHQRHTFFGARREFGFGFFGSVP